jgi:hypothetical protein
MGGVEVDFDSDITLQENAFSCWTVLQIFLKFIKNVKELLFDIFVDGLRY